MYGSTSRDSLSKRQSQWSKTNPIYPSKLDDDDIIAPSPRRNVQMLDTMPVPTNVRVYETNIDLLQKLDLIFDKLTEKDHILYEPNTDAHVSTNTDVIQKVDLLFHKLDQLLNRDPIPVSTNTDVDVSQKIDLLFHKLDQLKEKNSIPVSIPPVDVDVSQKIDLLFDKLDQLKEKNSIPVSIPPVDVDVSQKIDLLFHKLDQLTEKVIGCEKTPDGASEESRRVEGGTIVGSVVEEINNNTNNIINKLENINSKLDIIYETIQHHQKNSIERFDLLFSEIVSSKREIPHTPERRVIQPPHFELPKIVDTKPIEIKEKEKDTSVKDNLSLLKKNVTFVLENNKEYFIK
jgi:hypothetical protein